jgi:nitrite reductase/ring-hydroxylating ferredoxin subunit
MADWTERLNRFIDSLQADRRPERSLASSREELDELRMAARLAGSRTDNPSPNPEFLNRLRAELSVGPSPVSQRFSRALFLRAAGLWVAGLASGIGIDVAARYFRPLTGATASLPTGRKLAGGTWFSVGPLSQLTDQSVIPFDAGAVPAFVLRDGQSVRALSRVCTHMGCLLRYNAPERELGCPCHGAVFDLNGKVDPGYDVMSLPPLPSIDVRVEKGTVYVLGA